MCRLTGILRAAHCRSTHHYFAIDALAEISTAQGQRLGKLLLKHYDAYLSGAKAPDTKFRDFQNHVLHVSQNNWGGAPAACQQWLQTSLDHLNARRWRKAAFACGVLSHYFLDPLMPLHTAQSEREAIVHRPLEWSVFKSYDTIGELLQQAQLQASFRLAPDANWISKAVLANATVAHQYYDRLIEIYDLEQGCRQPTQGLDAEAQQILAGLFGIARAGWASVLARVADSVDVDLPEASLTLPSILATLDMPLNWILRRIADAHERKAAQALLREYQATGTVQRQLSREVRQVQQAFNADSRTEPSTSPGVAQQAQAKSSAISLDRQAEDESSAAADRRETRRLDTVSLPIHPSTRHPDEQVVSHRGPHLPDPEAALVDAPSIGPKTAKRFAKIGIQSIREFLDADAEQMAQHLRTRWITSDLICDWQAQARLFLAIANLRSFEAQLLVAASFRTPQSLVGCAAEQVLRQIKLVAATAEGQRMLRGSSLPALADCQAWIAAATSACVPSQRHAA